MWYLETTPQVILTNEKDLRRMATSLQNYKYISKARNLKNASAVDYHYVRDEVYWSDTTKQTIMRSSFLGSSQKQNVLIDNDLGQVEGIAIDWVKNKLYWSDRKNGNITLAGLDGQDREVVLSGLGDPVSIALDPLNDKLYYSVWGSGAHIGQSALNGSNPTSLVGAVSRPTGLSIDFVKKRLYWADVTTKQIEYASLSGTGRTVVYTNGKEIYSLSVFEDRVLFVDSSLYNICYVNKFTGKGYYCRLLSEFSHVRDLKIAHPLKQQGQGNFCVVQLLLLSCWLFLLYQVVLWESMMLLKVVKRTVNVNMAYVILLMEVVRVIQDMAESIVTKVCADRVVLYHHNL